MKLPSMEVALGTFLIVFLLCCAVLFGTVAVVMVIRLLAPSC